jgi:predicted DNA-binding helix-hairpin-helix protein
LISKNVASEIAEKLCESVASQLIGKQLGSFTRVSTTVKNAMEESLTRILTPKRRIDILREVQAVRSIHDDDTSQQPPFDTCQLLGATRKATLLDSICRCQRCWQVNLAVKGLLVAVEQ